MALTDARLAKLAQEYRELKERAARLTKSAEKRSKKIVDEMERRGTKSIDHTGTRVTVVQNESLKYDEEGLLLALPPRVRKKVTTAALDRSKLAQAQQEGLVPDEILEEHSSVVYSKAYIRVTEAE